MSQFLSIDAATGFAVLLEIALKATLVLAAAAVASWFLRGHSAALRHLTWGIALAALLALPLLHAAGPKVRVPVPAGLIPSATLRERTPAVTPRPSWKPEQRATLPNHTLAGAQPVTPEPSAAKQEKSDAAQSLTVLSSELNVAAPEAKAAEAVTPAASPAAATRAPMSWQAVVLSVWFIGCAALLAWFALGHIALRVLLRDATALRDNEWQQLGLEAAETLRIHVPFLLLQGGDLSMPVAFGLLRPRVLLPSGVSEWSLDRRRAVLLHELAHVKRHDCLTQALAQIVCALFWFHPGAWFAAQRLRVERERACDDLVLASSTRATDYADHLLQVARSLRASRIATLGAVAFARPSQFEGRLLAVLDPARDRSGMSVRRALPPALAGLVLLALVSVVRPVPQASAHSSKASARVSQAPVRVVTRDGDEGLDERYEWAIAQEESKGHRWIGWQIESPPDLQGNLLADTAPIDFSALSRRSGLRTLADVLAGVDVSSWPKDDDKGGPIAVLLDRDDHDGFTRVRIQSLALPADLGGAPVYWLGAAQSDDSYALLRRLADAERDPEVRSRLVEAIGMHVRTQSTAPYLLGLAEGSQDEDVRRAAIEGLSRHHSPGVAKKLAEIAIDDGSGDIRRIAVESIGRMGTTESLNILLDIAKNAGSEDARRQAFESLGQQISDEDALEAVEPTPPTPEVWPTPEPTVAPEAPETSESPQAVVAPLATLQASRRQLDQMRKDMQRAQRDMQRSQREFSKSRSDAGDEEVMRGAIDALSRYPEAQAFPRLREIAESHPNSDIRAMAVESLGRLGTPAAKSVIEALAWKSESEDVRRVAIDAIAHGFPADQSLPLLSRIASSHPDEDSQRMAVDALGRIDDPRAFAAIDDVLDHGSGDAQRQAAECLSRRDEPGTFARLVKLARTHPNEDVRRQAVESIGRRDEPQVLPTLVSLAREGGNPDIARQAAESIGRRGDPGALNALASLTRPPAGDDVQRQAVESLGRREEPGIPNMLLDIVRTHPSPDIQRQAVESLGLREDVDAMKVLGEIAASHPSSDVRRQAVETMSRRDPDAALPVLEKILKTKSAKKKS